MCLLLGYVNIFLLFFVVTLGFKVDTLQPYFDQSGVSAERVSGHSLELIIASWLNEIIHKKADEIDSSQQWLIESGLYNAVVDGSIDREAMI